MSFDGLRYIQEVPSLSPMQFHRESSHQGMFVIRAFFCQRLHVNVRGNLEPPCLHQAAMSRKNKMWKHLQQVTVLTKRDGNKALAQNTCNKLLYSQNVMWKRWQQVTVFGIRCENTGNKTMATRAVPNGTREGVPSLSATASHTSCRTRTETSFSAGLHENTRPCQLAYLCYF